MVIDSRGRLSGVLHVFRRMEYVRDILLLVSHQTPEEYIRFLEDREYQYIRAGTDRVDLRAAVEELYSRFGVRTLVSDTGGRLDTALLESGLVDEISLVVAPVLSGETNTLLYRPDSKMSIPLTLQECRELNGGYVHLLYGVRNESG